MSSGINHSGRHLLATALALALVLALLGLVSLDDIGSRTPPDTLVLRPVQLMQPAPPPPPPPPVGNQNNSNDTLPNLATATIDVPIDLLTMNLDVQLQAGTGDIQGLLGNGIGGLDKNLGADWNTVIFSDLDGIPTYVNQPVFNDYPWALIDQKIYDWQIRLHVMIDEQGRVHVLNVLNNLYPEYNAVVARFAEQVKFTAPTQLGIPVKTEYGWTLNLSVLPP